MAASLERTRSLSTGFGGRGPGAGALAILLVALLAPSGLQAQLMGMGRRGAEGAEAYLAARTGADVPVSALNDVEKAGPTVGLDLGYRVSPRISVGLDGEADFLKGRTVASGIEPDLNLYQYQGKVTALLLSPGDEGLSVLGGIGVGATTVNSDSFSYGGNRMKFDHTYLTGSADVELDLALNDRWTVYGNGGLDWIDMRPSETFYLADLAQRDGFRSGLAFPLSLGLRAHM